MAASVPRLTPPSVVLQLNSALYSPHRAASVRLARSEVRLPRDSAIRMAEVPLAQTTRWRAVVRVLRSPVRVLRSPIDSLSCALLPSSCALCGSPLPQLSSVPICRCLLVGVLRPDRPRLRPLRRRDACVRKAPRIQRFAAPAAWRRRPLSAPFRYGLYQGRMREAIHALKYDRLHPAARRLGPDAGRGHRATRRRGSRRNARRSRAAAPLQVRAARIQSVALACRRGAPIPAQDPSRSGGSRLRPARSCACAPPIARPASRRASAASTCAARFQSPIRRKSRRSTFCSSMTFSPPEPRREPQRKPCSKPGAASVWVATLARAQRAVDLAATSIRTRLSDDGRSTIDEAACEDSEIFTGAAMHATVQVRIHRRVEQPSF